VSLAFVDPTCRFKWSASGFNNLFLYRLTIAQGLTGVHPEGTFERCQLPASTGLIVDYEISGGQQQRYCRCDQGLCAESGGDAGINTTALEVGTYEDSFVWDGKNWNGPSDYNAPEGDLFPPGQYTVTVSATGGWDGGGAGWQDFAVTTTLPITITP